jgi:hypothetical protein
MTVVDLSYPLNDIVLRFGSSPSLIPFYLAISLCGEFVLEYIRFSYRFLFPVRAYKVELYRTYYSLLSEYRAPPEPLHFVPY